MLPLLNIALAGALIAAPTSNPSRVPDQGWFFYDTPPVVPPDPDPEPPQVAIEEPHAGGSDTSNSVGSVAWIRKNIDLLRDRAIDDPTPRNLELFSYVQKLMMDKSEVFARHLVAVNARNPTLDETISAPTNSPARMELNGERERAQKEAIEAIASKSIVWYFFRSDCPYCQSQDPILKYLADKHQVKFLPVSVDGLGLMDGTFPDFEIDTGQAKRLGVTSTPTLFLMHPPDRVVMLSVGMRALPDLVKRFVEVGRAEGLIDESLYQRAMNGLPRQYLTESFDPSAISDPDDPEQLLAALRAAGTHGRSEATVSDALGESTNATPLTTRPSQ